MSFRRRCSGYAATASGSLPRCALGVACAGSMWVIACPSSSIDDESAKPESSQDEEATNGVSTPDRQGTLENDIDNTAEEPPPALTWIPDFETLQLSTDFVAEGAAVADLDGDGELDLIAGAVWYRGPSFEEKYQIDDAPAVDVTSYARYFLTFVDDLNGDGASDVINIGDAGGSGVTGAPNAWWYENPGTFMVTSRWTRHDLFDGLVSNESPAYVNLVGDARKELVFMSEGRLGWAEPGADPTEPWTFHAISDAVYSTPYVHGLGVGDVDGDGQMDVLDASTWWRRAQSSGWVGMAADFTQGVVSPIAGGAQMYAFDVDGDGDSDVITSLSGHGYGLSWFEQTTSGFVPHAILPAGEAEGNVSQLHAVMIADMNGDGLTDIVTGKRYFAHASGDPGVDAAALLYWFELIRDAEGVRFEPHLIHDDSGVGCSFAVADVNGNGRPDVLTSSKKGTFLHRQ